MRNRGALGCELGQRGGGNRGCPTSGQAPPGIDVSSLDAFLSPSPRGHSKPWKSQVRSQPLGEAREPSEVKVVVRVTRASSVCPSAAFWAMGKEVVLVSNILKEVNLVFALEESSGNAMHYCVSPALIVETSGSFEVLEILRVCFATPEVHIGDFKITPEVTQTVGPSTIVGKEIHGIVLCHILRVFLDEVSLCPRMLEWFACIQA